MKYFMKGVEWLGSFMIATMFVLMLIISIPFAIVGSMMNDKHKRRIKK